MSEQECIRDAGAFHVGRNNYWHHVKTAEKGRVLVTALCGTYAYSDYFNTYDHSERARQDYSTRPARWASGFEPTDIECPTCVIVQRGHR